MSSKEISIRQWVKRGNMLLSTDALNYDDPDHPYNQAVALGVRPEDYGIVNPIAAEFDDKSRNQLIEEILELREYIRGFYLAGH